MFSATRKALEDFDNQHDFERMCADLLNAYGYKDVVPIAPGGGSDRGKDITFKKQDGKISLACCTLRKDIEKKFYEDFRKRKIGDFAFYILFTTAPTTAKNKEDFARYCEENLQSELVIYDLEGLRSLLETPAFDHLRHYLKLPVSGGDQNRDYLESLRNKFNTIYQAELDSLSKEPLIEKISTRGFWKIIIRPEHYVDNRIPLLSELNPIIEKSRVHLPKVGWSFPGLEDKRPQRKLNSISQSIEAYNFGIVESWSLWQSGQFYYLEGGTSEWQDTNFFNVFPKIVPGTVMLIEHALFRFTHIFEFARKLLLNKPFYDDVEQLWIEILITGLKNQILRFEGHNRNLWNIYSSNIEQFPTANHYTREELTTNSKKLAVDNCIKLLQIFGCDDLNEITLSNIQKEFYQ